ncbi:MAG: MG2 domain-containing protein [Bryobacteraceae bacterium]|nr:MG2 domain-containing protein [Bryobacteraceae bacterium]
MRRAIALLGLAIGVGTAQGPPSFTLSTDRSFAPGEQARVALSTLNVDQLEFRLYKVRDAVRFFSDLPSPNGFGGQASPPPRKRSMLERFHSWKYRTRTSMRHFVRDQFGSEEFAGVRALIGARKPESAATGYAELPLLNPDQLVRRWKVKAEFNKERPWERQAIGIDGLQPGLYIVEAAADGLRAATIVNVTPLALIKKIAPGEIAILAVDSATGEVQPNVDVKVVNNREVAASAKTDANGFAKLKVEAVRGDDVVIVAQSARGLAISTASAWSLIGRDQGLSEGYIYTDRPIYRPGHKVGWRAILRAEDTTGWKLPAIRDVAYEIANPEGQILTRGNAKLTEFGTASGEWTVPADTKLGYYSVVLRAGESAQSGSFQVEEYKKPEYEVKVTPNVARTLQGGAVEFTIEARYFFGEPVANAKVKYRVSTARYWMPWWADEYDSEYDGYGGGYDPGEELEATLDAEGKTVVRVRAEPKNFDYRLFVEAGVTDKAGREVTGRGSSLATVGNFALHAQPDKWVYQPGDTAKIAVEARTFAGQPAAGVRFSVGGAVGVTGADGKGTVPLAILPKDAAVQLPVVARTPEGREIKETVYLWVSGVYGGYQSTRGEEITIVPDKRSYQPGETAKILVLTGVKNATVLLGVEGRGLHRTETRRNAPESFTFDVPIAPEYQPNFYVTASLLKDGKFRTGAKSVKVPPVEKILNVSVTPSKEQFKPGEPATYTVVAKDFTGKPVAAEFSLGVVDEALYGVAPDTTPAIDKNFYGRMYDRVQTDSSLAYYFYGSAGKRPMPIARMHHTLAAVKPPKVNDPRVRKAFPDTALWLANVVTDANGRAEARLQFPDSITAWRATARGVTVDTKVGAAVNRVITRKDLILRLAVPRFVTEGDEVVVSAIVNNYLKSEKKARVSLEAKGAEILDGSAREGSAAAGVETPFDFRIKAKSLEQLTLIATALTDEESDALEITLPVIPYGVKVTDAKSGSGPGQIEFGESRTIDVRITPSLAGAMFGALDYLATYPYGCTEQTLSSFVPSVVALSTARSLGLPIDAVTVEKKANAGAERLRDMQNPDGGWGWWGGTDSNAVMTTMALAGIGVREEAGTAWWPDSKERAKKWLRAAFAREKRADPDFRAFMAYALNEPAAINEVWDAREQLSPLGLAYLGLRVAEPRGNVVADRLEKLAQVSDSEAYWRSDRDPVMEFDVDATPETSALALKLLVKARPKSPLVEKAARWLVNHRDEGYYWATTKQTANVVYGLADYLKITGELNPRLAAEIKLNGESVYSKELLQADALSPTPIGVRLMPRVPTNKLDVSATGEGKLYWSAVATSHDPKPRNNIKGNRTLGISRKYFRVLPDGSTVPFNGQAKLGETLESRIAVTGTNWRYLMVEDPIPASAEFARERLSYWWTHRELRDDRAVYFETWYTREREFSSRMKLTRPGKYRISPARVTPMYQPGVMASSDALDVEVLP